ncbi:MAG: MauE/DoxX family redox-associated membrane protein [Bacteroidota bacterium]
MTHTYNVTGITCASCEKKVKGALTALPDVQNITIDRLSNTATIQMGKHIATETLQAALREYPKYQLTERAHTQVIPAYSEEETKSWFATYRPLLLVFGYITLVSVVAGTASGSWNVWEAMRVFMAGFFLVFSFFKLLDLNGFADSYSMYDIVAKKIRAWGYVYPFVELALGIAFLTDFQPVTVNMITFIVMTVSIIGVLQSVFNKRKIKCACLGAVFNLPMSTVTIIEDLLMIGMSLVMLFKML